MHPRKSHSKTRAHTRSQVSRLVGVPSAAGRVGTIVDLAALNDQPYRVCIDGAPGAPVVCLRVRV
jgi:hypothetical protein